MHGDPSPSSSPPAPARQYRVRLQPPDAAALLALAGLVLFVSRDALLRGRVFYQRDIHLQWFGQVESFVRAVASGAWPLWDPFVSFGQPLLANPNAEVLYPLTWLNLLMRPWTYYSFFFAAHLLLAGAGVYALGKRLGISAPGSCVGGALWILSGPVLSLGNLWNHLAAAAWLPWVVLAADVAFASGRPRHLLLWGVALAVQILAGSPDLVAMTALAVLAVVPRHLASHGSRGRSGLRLARTAAVAAVFAVALSAAQLLPALELASRSSRRELGEATRTYWSVHPLGMIQALLPVTWNELPLRPDYRAALFESREPLLFSLYLGVPALALAAAALCGRRGPLRGSLAAAGATAMLFALGPHSPVYGLLVAVLPPLRVLRYPSKAMVLAAFCGALLGGMGFDAWREREGGDPSGRRRWLLAVGLPLAAISLLAAGASLAARYRAEAWGPLFLTRSPTGPSFASILAPTLAKLTRGAGLAGILALLVLFRRRAAPWAATAAALIAVADLALTHDRLNGTAPRELFTLRPQVLQEIRQDDHRRLFVEDYLAEPGLSSRALGRDFPYLVPGPPVAWAGAAGMRVYPVPPVAAAWGVYDSFAGDRLGIQPTPLAKLYALLVRSEGTPLRSRLLRLGAVSQVLALHTQGFEDLIPVTSVPGPFFEPIRVFGVPDPLPRAYAVNGVRVAGDAEALDALQGSTFEPAREVILPEGAARAPTPEPAGSVRILGIEADRVRLDAQLSTPGHVVLVDGYDPGWRATVDGQPASVLRANVAFRAVPVPSGHHVIDLVYRPRAVIAGLVISATALVLGCGLALFDRVLRS